MYSDDDYSPPKQPRVVVLPGERGQQEMYTATALSRAAAIAAASAAIVAQATQQQYQQQQQQEIPPVVGVVIGVVYSPLLVYMFLRYSF